MTQKIPRQPTEEEKKQLVEFLFEERPYDANDDEVREEIEARVADAYIAVFDDYITNSVGYAGKVMVVVYDGSPEFTETFTWGDEGYLQQEVKIPTTK